MEFSLIIKSKTYRKLWKLWNERLFDVRDSLVKRACLGKGFHELCGVDLSLDETHHVFEVETSERPNCTIKANELDAVVQVVNIHCGAKKIHRKGDQHEIKLKSHFIGQISNFFFWKVLFWDLCLSSSPSKLRETPRDNFPPPPHQLNERLRLPSVAPSAHHQPHLKQVQLRAHPPQSDKSHLSTFRAFSSQFAPFNSG